MIDIIVPVFNEEDILLMDDRYFRALSQRARLVFVDGGSQDRTRELAGQISEIRSGPRGRALQKNAGAQESTADVLLFLHADTRIDASSLDDVELAVEQGAVGGCFKARIVRENLVFSLFECLLNGRAKHLRTIDGDMGMFVRRDVFERLGGFARFSAMEDIIFSRALRKQGPVVQLNALINVSARKWQEQGFFRTLTQYSGAYLWFWFCYPFIQEER